MWNDAVAQSFGDDVLQLRVYTSRLLGQDPDLTMHGGGNTSVKVSEVNFFGEQVDVLYVKGSGWDLGTIEAAGFSPVRLDVLLKLAEFESLSDSVIVREQRAAMLDPTAPNPSVEAILHAIIPFKFVDHTHADVVVTLTNTPEGEAIMREIYGERMLVVPYIMPGFTLARKVYEMTREVNWAELDGIILMNHGLFTFADTARKSYEQMIALVTQAEDYLAQRGAFDAIVEETPQQAVDLVALSQLRKVVSTCAGKPLLAHLNHSERAVGFSRHPDVDDIATRGLITPDHVIRTKRIPVIVEADTQASVDEFVAAYQEYFARNSSAEHMMLDPAPRWAVWKGVGSVTFGDTVKAIRMADDVTEHTIKAIQWAESFSRWQPLSEREIFDVEYWELEQAKLKKGGSKPLFQGKVALVTGAASGIGLACARVLAQKGACVVGLDINPATAEILHGENIRGLVCDLTDVNAVNEAVRHTILAFGGLDVLISNAGLFPSSQTIETMDAVNWERSLAVNLTSHQRMLQTCIPYLKNGVDPSVVVIGSKNFPAPGPGAGAYSVAKAGITQLARVAALELASSGIRVNVVHPDAVFDTGIWTEEVIEKRARSYNMTPEQYMTKNLLGTKITSADVAEVVCALASPVFGKTTGAQIPIDGGNDRVI